jgi:hypothetical protein
MQQIFTILLPEPPTTQLQNTLPTEKSRSAHETKNGLLEAKQERARIKATDLEIFRSSSSSSSSCNLKHGLQELVRAGGLAVFLGSFGLLKVLYIDE